MEDFNNTEKSQSQNSADVTQSSPVAKTDSKRPDPPLSLWNEEFLQQATARFEQNIQALFSPGA